MNEFKLPIEIDLNFIRKSREGVFRDGMDCF